MNLALAAVGSCAALFAVLALLQRNLYSSALCVMAVLFQVAAIFFLLSAQILGFLQVLVYAGAIMILIVMAIMSSRADVSRKWATFRLPRWLVAAVLIVPFGELGLILKYAPEATPWASITPELERQMAALLFGRYALMTEAVGLLVLISAIAMLQEPQQ